MSTLEGLKRAVIRIDSDYWRRVQDGKNRSHLARPPQDSSLRSNKPDYPKSTTVNRLPPPERPVRDQPRLYPSSIPAPMQLFSSPVSPLGSDRHLTPTEHQHCMDLGLCLHYSQLGHLARNFPKQATRNLPTTEAHRALIDLLPLFPELPKNKTAALPIPRRMTAFLKPGNPF